ncbi:MAG: hypothetical protein NVV66_00300 [Cellulomonas sp.]|uniref:hypothetical protein n=1 Tax=Cellulomonas sp. TaxID=40001 RepID=UPI002583B083|nr:hypothetical protein [Cellulomonas sp.]MCR6703192.1 hypothetical protein [Cellulomonas sp.]
MIFQQFNLFASRTVAGNVAFPLRSRGGPAQTGTAAWPSCSTSSACSHARTTTRASSGPEAEGRHRRALAAQPSILLADECTSAFDPQTTQDVPRLLQGNTEPGGTIAVITQELDVVRTIADSVAVLEHGRLA